LWPNWFVTLKHISQLAHTAVTTFLYSQACVRGRKITTTAWNECTLSSTQTPSATAAQREYQKVVHHGFNQGCGAGNQISSSGSSSGQIFFGSGSYIFRFLAPAPEQFGLKTEKTLHNLCNSLEPEPIFQAPAPPSKKFWPRLQPSTIAWAPAPQPWFQPAE